MCLQQIKLHSRLMQQVGNSAGSVVYFFASSPAAFQTAFEVAAYLWLSYTLTLLLLPLDPSFSF